LLLSKRSGKHPFLALELEDVQDVVTPFLILAWVLWTHGWGWSHGSRDAIVMIADGIHESSLPRVHGDDV
jgi:hypothetical protein